MKRTLLLLAVAIMAAAGCGKGTRLRTGDLIFVGIPMDYGSGSGTMAEAIGAATGQGQDLNIIHVAIAEVRHDSVWIIDATIRHGVDRHPLDTFLADFTLKDGSYPVFSVMRLKDSRGAERFVENAKMYLGLPYDHAFLPGNDAYYCSELVRESYVKEDGTRLFSEAPMNFKDESGEFPAYWSRLFARLGMDVPQGVMGTNPLAMSREDILVPVDISLVPQVPDR